MFKRILLGSILASICVVNAQAFEFKGADVVSIPLTKPHVVRGRDAIAPNAAARANFKTVVLMKADLNDKERKAFTGFDPRVEKSATTRSSDLPSSADVGMNNVPVLDQGMHGSCVTFATTAAIDALIGKGDYVSQLCSLELGSYLEARSEVPSGWEGSMGSLVLNQITNFGFVTVADQKKGVCSGVLEYPGNSGVNTGKPMSLDDFHAAREKVENLYWEPVLTPMTRILNAVDHGYHAEAVLQSVKKMLASKPEGRQQRVTFGVLLPTAHCFAGACAKRNKPNDTWALTDEINYDIIMPKLDGHEMVITGYDDNATVVDNDGKTHQGIFTLRNSWGTDVGDDGNFYMTYDFFKKFVFEVQQVVMIEEELLKSGT